MLKLIEKIEDFGNRHREVLIVLVAICIIVNLFIVTCGSTP